MDNVLQEPASKYNYITPQEYLQMERASEEKHEYFDGYVQAMSGPRLKHNDIVANVVGQIYGF